MTKATGKEPPTKKKARTTKRAVESMPAQQTEAVPDQVFATDSTGAFFPEAAGETSFRGTGFMPHYHSLGTNNGAMPYFDLSTSIVSTLAASSAHADVPTLQRQVATTHAQARTTHGRGSVTPVNSVIRPSLALTPARNGFRDTDIHTKAPIQQQQANELDAAIRSNFTACSAVTPDATPSKKIILEDAYQPADQYPLMCMACDSGAGNATNTTSSLKRSADSFDHADISSEEIFKMWRMME